MEKYLIDNSVLHGWANTSDVNHLVCKSFFESHKNDKLFFPILALFEFHAARARRMKSNTFEGIPGTIILKNQMFIDVDRKLFDYCQKNKIFELFSLKGADLIYACIAKVGSYTLVTCDSDFDEYRSVIKIQKLTK